MMKSDNNKALFSNHYLDELASLRSQIMTSKGRDGRRYLPYAFTKQGVDIAGRKTKAKRRFDPFTVNYELFAARICGQCFLDKSYPQA